MNLASLIEKLSFQSGFTDSAYRSRWKQFINDAIREHARRRPWEGLEDVTDLSSNGTKFLVLPHYVDSIVHLLNRTQNTPVERSGDWDREATQTYAQATPGAVMNYDRLGDVPLLKNPSGYMWVSSTHASDLQTLCFTGIVANSGASGTGLAESVQTLSVFSTGTSPITLSSLFTKVLSVSKSTDSNGDYFIYDAGASNSRIGYIGRYDDDSHFKRLQLLFVPSAQTIFELRFRYAVPKLALDEQSPHPSVSPDFIIQWALAKHYEERAQLQKSAGKEQQATRVLEAEANKDQNFNEPWSQIIPALRDPYSDDYFNGYYR